MVNGRAVNMDHVMLVEIQDEKNLYLYFTHPMGNLDTNVFLIPFPSAERAQAALLDLGLSNIKGMVRGATGF